MTDLGNEETGQSNPSLQGDDDTNVCVTTSPAKTGHIEVTQSFQSMVLLIYSHPLSTYFILKAADIIRR